MGVDGILGIFQCCIDITLSLGECCFNVRFGGVEIGVNFVLTTFGVLFELLEFFEYVRVGNGVFEACDNGGVIGECFVNVGELIVLDGEFGGELLNVGIERVKL